MLKKYFFTLHEDTCTYAIVHFVDDKLICTVPVKRIDPGQSSSIEISSIYLVKWTNRKQYYAEVLALGKYNISQQL